MTLLHHICICISTLTVSILLTIPSTAKAQGRLFSIQKDSIPMMRGFAVSVDLAGPAQLALSDRGEIEGALRLNLHDQYYPIVEVGYGMADHREDDVTGISYKTSAPYFRMGCDLNLLKKKHVQNRLYAGIRYAFSLYNVDITHATLQDPVWGWNSPVNIKGEDCNQHWIEVVFGLDTKVAGPLHLGWNVRYKRRITHKDTSIGQTWYVPGYGRQGSTRLGANFNIILDI